MRGNDGHTRCAYTPVPLLGLTSASTWLVYMHVSELHVRKLYNMVFKAILCNKHNTDMHRKDDYMVVRECMYMHLAFNELINMNLIQLHFICCMFVQKECMYIYLAFKELINLT